MADDTPYSINLGNNSIYESTPVRRKLERTPLGYMMRFFRCFPMQCVMILLTIVDIAFLIYEFSTRDTQFEMVTLTTALIFFLEVLVNVGFHGREAFRFDKWWVVAEVVIVTGSFIVEYVEYVLHYAIENNEMTSALRYLRAARFLRVGILWKTRWRNFTASLRRLVSADRRRYQAGGYDLDLTYVYSNIIATSWPSEGSEGMYRNHINNVSAFLDEMHPDTYFVYNLCSERSYDESKFHDRVHRYRLDDHNPPELQMMVDFAVDCAQWLRSSPKNVAVIHCKGGKGRTGTMTCGLLLYTKMQPSAAAALDHFGAMRTSEDAKNFQGVESPSQYRYVHYFERVLKMPGMAPPPRTVRLTSLRIDWLPFMWWSKGVDKLWFAIVLHPNTDRVLHYVSNPTVTFDPKLPENPYGSPSKRRGMSVSPNSLYASTPAFENDSIAPSFLECQPFGGNYVIYANGDFSKPLNCDLFNAKYGAVRDGAAVPEAKLDRNLRVTVEVNTSSIPPLAGDTVMKFFYNEDQPNTLHAAMQVWFHPAMEGNVLHYARKDIDGPHKEKKPKKFPAQLAIDIGLDTVTVIPSKSSVAPVAAAVPIDTPQQAAEPPKQHHTSSDDVSQSKSNGATTIVAAEANDEEARPHEANDVDDR